MPDERAALGRKGERLARRFLRKNGYVVLYRNFRAPRGGEVDIVARDGETLVFVEVKTRKSLRFGHPEEAVDLKKQRLIARGALEWLRLLDRPEVCSRFDVVEVLLVGGKPQLRIIRDAFPLPPPYLG